MTSKTIDFKYLLERVKEITECIEEGNSVINNISETIERAQDLFDMASIEIEDLKQWISDPEQWWTGDEDYEENDWLEDIKDE